MCGFFPFSLKATLISFLPLILKRQEQSFEYNLQTSVPSGQMSVWMDHLVDQLHLPQLITFSSSTCILHPTSRTACSLCFPLDSQVALSWYSLLVPLHLLDFLGFISSRVQSLVLFFIYINSFHDLMALYSKHP